MATTTTKKKKIDKKVSQKIRIKLKSFDHKVIDGSVKTIIQTVENTGATITGPIPLPNKIEKFTVNRSTFVNKDARDQYEIRTHCRLIYINDTNPKTIEALTTLELPSGVSIEIQT